jgi:hypothetical protein
LSSPFRKSFGSPMGIALLGTPIAAWYISQIKKEETDTPSLSISYPKEPMQVGSLRLLLRVLFLGIIITPAVALCPFWIIYEYVFRSDALRMAMIRLLCWTLENLGATFIKV